MTNNSAAGTGGGTRIEGAITTVINATVSHNTGATGGEEIRRDQRHDQPSEHGSSRQHLGAIGHLQSNGSIGNAANNLDSAATCGFAAANGSPSDANPNLGSAREQRRAHRHARTRLTQRGHRQGGHGRVGAQHRPAQRRASAPTGGTASAGAQHDVGAYEAAAVAARTAAPTVNSPICTGATSVSGTSTEANGTSIEVFKNGVAVVGPVTVSGGTWTK